MSNSSILENLKTINASQQFKSNNFSINQLVFNKNLCQEPKYQDNFLSKECGQERENEMASEDEANFRSTNDSVSNFGFDLSNVLINLLSIIFFRKQKIIRLFQIHQTLQLTFRIVMSIPNVNSEDIELLLQVFS